jgi:hypothetical protein
MVRVIAVVVVLLGFAGESSSESKKKKSVWQPLAQKGAKWTLDRKTNDGRGGKLEVTVADVRKVGKADVARLAYTRDGADTQLNEFAQIAIVERGAYAFRDDATDADIAKALKKKVQFADPPAAVKPTARNHLHFVFVPKQRKGTYCVGESFEDCGAAPCAAWICVDETGIVGVGDFEPGGVYGFEPDGISRG